MPSKGQRRHPVEYIRLYVEVNTDTGLGEYAWDKLHFVKAGKEDSAIDSAVLKYLLSQPPYLRTAAEASAGGNV